MSNMFFYLSISVAYGTKILTCEHDIDPSACLCDKCLKLRRSRQGNYQTICDEVLEYSLKSLKDKGGCMVKDVMDLFKDKILDQH